MKKYLAAAVAAVSLTIVVVPATASATVLYEPPPDTSVGGCISLNYWYQSYSGGSRYISAYVTKNGRRVTRTVSARADSTWRSKRLLCPQVPGRYSVHFTTGGLRWSEGVKVGIGD